MLMPEAVAAALRKLKFKEYSFGLQAGRKGFTKFLFFG